MRKLFHFYKNKPEWMNDFYDQLKTLLNEKKSLVIVISSFFVAISISAVVSDHKNKSMSDFYSSQNKHNETILRELSDINAVLQDVERNPTNTKQQKLALENLESNVATVQKSIADVAKSSDVQKISGQISSVKDDFDSQMSDLKKTVSQSMGDKEYLDASALPFHIVSVDVIAGQSYVSVNYGDHILPLAVGDLLTRWRVVSADYDAGIAEFMNEKNQYVKIDLQGV